MVYNKSGAQGKTTGRITLSILGLHASDSFGVMESLKCVTALAWVTVKSFFWDLNYELNYPAFSKNGDATNLTLTSDRDAERFSRSSISKAV